MRFGVLGATEVTGEPVGGLRLRGLLAMLLLEAGRTVGVTRLLDGLYGETPPTGAVNALQSQVSRLRGLLGESAEVRLTPSGYRLCADPGDVDAHRFAALAGDGQRALTGGDPRAAATTLREALRLWRGPALADVRALPFAEPQAVRLDAARLAATEHRIEADLLLVDPDTLVDELRELVLKHPLRERLRAQLMRALADSGRRVEALQVFHDGRAELSGALGTGPSRELEQVHQAILRGTPPTPGRNGTATRPDRHAEHEPRRQHGPVPAAGPQGPRARLTSFVGRDEEIERLAGMVRAGRLVTVTGPGGSGKTSLAAEAARDLDDVCFVELAPLGDGADLPLAVLTALGVRAPLPLPRAAPEGSAGLLARALADRGTLLVLDNCEHLVEAVAPFLDRLLGACPRVRVLATSREAIGVPGETLLPLAPLPLPDEDLPLAEAAGQPAVRLLADRAAAARPDFTVTAANLGAVLRICRALDGLPLAIELAAARLRVMTPEDLAARLDDRFRLLTSGSRVALPRHRTLHAVVAWSWDLLTPVERDLAARLSVFASGATAPSAERVCGATLDLLTALADKSLVRSDGGRFRMLETVRAFCAERLAESGEQEAVRRAHAEHFADLAAAAEPYLKGTEQLARLGELAAEHDELRAALRWAIDTGRAGVALRLAGSLWIYWVLRGLRHEAGSLSEEVLGLVGDTPPAGLEAEYAMCALQLATAGGTREDVRPTIIRAQELVDALPAPPDHPLLRMLRPYVAIVDADYRAMLPALLAAAEGESDPWARSFARLLLGYLRLGAGDVGDAEKDLRETVAGFRAAGDRWGAGQAMMQLAELAGWRGDHATALATTEAALELTAPLGADEDTAILLARQGAERARAGDLAGSRADLERAVRLTRTLPGTEAQAVATYELAEIARLEGDLPRARELYEQALAGCRELWLGSLETRGRVLTGLGRLEAACGATDLALACLTDAFDRLVKVLDLPGASAAVEALAEVALLGGDAERAAFLLGAAVALKGTEGHEGPDVARTAAGARRVLGAEAYERARGRGALLPRDRVGDVLRG
ncbi:BTAD domain-containing putative transcriptional regulator [Nonomuraea sp. NPDC046570]|uniref:AfsR/SARP family transcriptional regulator n=1 Tax=Nonomuraea sp. NPDC046570 TaxID=3155255 RepID=UPI0033F35256